MATTLDERRQKTSQRPAAAMDLGSVDGAAPLNLTPPGTMRPDAPAPVPTQPAPQFTRTNAGPMLAEPPAAAPVAPAVDPQQQRLANQTAMYVQGAQAAAAAQPPSPVQQMMDAPARPAPMPSAVPSSAGINTMNQRAYAEAEARKTAANPTGSIYGMGRSAAAPAPTPAPRPAAQEMAQAPVSATGTEAELLRLQGVPVQDPNAGSAWRSLGSALMYSSDKQAMQDKARQVNYGNEGRRTPMPVPAVNPAGPRATNEAQAKNPAADQGQVPGAVKPMPQGAQPEVGPPGGYTSTRVDGVYRKGNTFTDEAGTRDTAFLNRGAITPQNQNAAEQLAANYNSNQQALARLQAANPALQPAQAAAPRQFDRAASIRALSDLRSPEAIALRNLRIDAQQEMEDGARLGRAARGGNTAGQAYAALLGELTTGTRQGQVAEMQDATNRYTADTREAGATQRALMGEEGATRRAGMTNEVQQGELGLKREAQDFTSRAAQRLEKAQADYLAADTPEKKAAAAKVIRELQGKEKPESWKGVALQGGTDALGNKTESVLAAVNEATGEMRRYGQGQGQAAALPPKDKLVAGTTYPTPKGPAVWDGKNFIPVQQ